MSKLTGRRAVITGAASGIGRASAILFAKEGAAVCAVDYDAAGVEAVAAEIRAAGGQVVALAGDMGREEDVQASVDTCVRELGGIDIYFANAGIIGDMLPITQQTVESAARVFAVNFFGPMLAIKHAAPAMMAQGRGAIVCTASVAAFGGHASPVPYGASKAAVVNLVKVAACELAGTGVRVNAICPGLIETGMTKFVFEQARERGKEDKIGQLAALRRAGNPMEIAEVAAFLASDAASYVNGQTLVADGGLTSGLPFTPGSVIRVER